MQIQATQYCLQPSHYHSSAWLFYVAILVFSIIKSYTKIFLITPEYNCPMQIAQRAFNLMEKMVSVLTTTVMEHTLAAGSSAEC